MGWLSRRLSDPEIQQAGRDAPGYDKFVKADERVAKVFGRCTMFCGDVECSRSNGGCQSPSGQR